MHHDDSQILSPQRRGNWQMNLENVRLPSQLKRLAAGTRRLWWISLLAVLAIIAFVSGASSSGQVTLKKDVLILNEVGLSHALTNIIIEQLVIGVQKTPARNIEVYSESLDLLDFPDGPSFPELRDWLARKYGDHKLDAIVANGPDSIRFLSDYSDTLWLDVPVVICGSSADQAGNPKLNSRFTGTWQKREPGKTIEVAFSLFP